MPRETRVPFFLSPREMAERRRVILKWVEGSEVGDEAVVEGDVVVGVLVVVDSERAGRCHCGRQRLLEARMEAIVVGYSRQGSEMGREMRAMFKLFLTLSSYLKTVIVWCKDGNDTRSRLSRGIELV